MDARKPLVIEYVPVDRLVPYVGNARLHSADQVEKIAASIKRFGFNNPVLIDAEGMIVAGHGRLIAARQLGLDTIPVVRLGHLTDAERRAYTLADNRIAEDATWDPELLAREVAALQREADGLATLAGFGDKEIERLLLAAEGGGGGADRPKRRAKRAGATCQYCGRPVAARPASRHVR